MIRVVPLYLSIEHMPGALCFNFYHQNHKVCKAGYNFWKHKIYQKQKVVITFLQDVLWSVMLHFKAHKITGCHTVVPVLSNVEQKKVN